MSVKSKEKFPLPPGARLLKRAIKKEVGGWVPLDFDAEIILHGIRWLRAKDGFGGSRDRDDWVADVPELCLSVKRYKGNQWERPFEKPWTSFAAAVRGRVASAISNAGRRSKEIEKKHTNTLLAITMLHRARRLGKQRR